MSIQKNILIDGRWDGDTGIGRLYREVMQRVPAEAACTYVESAMGLGHPLSPLMLAKQINSAKADVFYSPSFMPPLYSKVPFIFTIHDLMHLFYYSKVHSLYYRYVIATLARNAKQIITVSEFSRQQLIERLGIKDDLISVVYNGVDQVFASNTEEAQLDRPYFLYVGNRRSYKNIPAMLTAFAKASISTDFIFALSGKPDAELADLIKTLDIESRVTFLGFIPEADLPQLYKGAYVTMFVSMMEGFGLPLIESMASGTPVLTSSASSLPELAEDAALCVDPNSIDAIRAGIERLVNDVDYYQQCGAKGKLRAAQFSWEDTAKKTWDIILS